jgi:hypothetical protein
MTPNVPNPIIPQKFWSAEHTDEVVVKQFLACAFCPETSTPTRIVFISGTTYCPEHAKQVLAQ